MAESVDDYNDLRELGIEFDNASSDPLTNQFQQAAKHLQFLLSQQTIDNETLLQLYGFYKQGLEGPCTIPKPSWYDMKGKSKWEAWNKLVDMPQTEAKIKYIENIKKLDPKFEPDNENSPAQESGVKVSMMQSEKPVGGKTIIDYIKEHNLMEIKNFCTKSNNLNKLDEEGLGLIHWASDIGFVDGLQILLDNGADVNLTDVDGQTALHYASSCGHFDCVQLLLSKGANVDLKDSEGLCARDVANDGHIKELL